MFKNKITWVDLVEKKDFSIFDMADFLYSDNSSQGLFKKSKFILRSFIYRKELKKCSLYSTSHRCKKYQKYTQEYSINHYDHIYSQVQIQKKEFR